MGWWKEGGMDGDMLTGQLIQFYFKGQNQISFNLLNL